MLLNAVGDSFPSAMEIPAAPDQFRNNLRYDVCPMMRNWLSSASERPVSGHMMSILTAGPIRYGFQNTPLKIR
jgi:hypothetical protein